MRKKYCCCIGLSHAELPDLLKKGEQAIIDEFNAHGSADDIANLHYILKGTACEEPLPDHVRQQIKTRKYHGGSLDDGEFDAGHKGKRFEDFVTHEYCCKANLVRPHVLALRLYTSSSYPCFNDHLRKNTKPHPFKMSVYYLNEAIKQLRSVGEEEFPDYHEEVSLWRGMRDKVTMAEFQKKGGTEMALMSTSRDKTVAFKYAASDTPLVFHFKARGLAQGVSIEFLSLYPKEKEYLYPPLTYLSPLGHAEEGGYQILTVQPQMP